jgi:hypothetical protein
VSLAKDFRGLPAEMRLTAAAAAALAVSLIFTWYQKSYFQSKPIQTNVSGLGAFSWVEAAVLLVAIAVLFLVWARSQKKAFHLPGGDGVAVTMAGGWAVLLLVWRLFDKPDIKGGSKVAGATIGIQWGIFIAFVAAGALVAAGARVRAAHRPEPPNPAADDVDWVRPDRPAREARPDRRPRDATAVTEAFRERPSWEGDVGEPPARAPRRGDEAQTRRMAGHGEDAETRRMAAHDEDAETRRFRDDDAATRKFRDDDPATRRLDEPPRLWDDDESAS